MQPQHLTHA